MGSRATPIRRAREQDLVAATRALFDERGMQDAPIEEIARAAGIARGLVYRHFSSKEELFVLTVTDYLGELADELGKAIAGAGADPVAQLEALTVAYARFCERFPAFLDCSLSLMHRPAGDLRDTVSETVWLRLGRDMAACLGQLSSVLREGAAAGVFRVDDPDYTANLLWTQGLGVMHLARIRIGVRELAPGVPGLFTVRADDVVASCVQAALAAAGVHR